MSQSSLHDSHIVYTTKRDDDSKSSAPQCIHHLAGRPRLTFLRCRGRAVKDGRRLAAFLGFRGLSGRSMWSSNSSGRSSRLILNAISFTLRRAAPRTSLEPGRTSSAGRDKQFLWDGGPELEVAKPTTRVRTLPFTTCRKAGQHHADTHRQLLDTSVTQLTRRQVLSSPAEIRRVYRRCDVRFLAPACTGKVVPQMWTTG